MLLFARLVLIPARLVLVFGRSVLVLARLALILAPLQCRDARRKQIYALVMLRCRRLRAAISIQDANFYLEPPESGFQLLTNSSDRVKNSVKPFNDSLNIPNDSFRRSNISASRPNEISELKRMIASRPRVGRHVAHARYAGLDVCLGVRDVRRHVLTRVLFFALGTAYSCRAEAPSATVRNEPRPQDPIVARMEGRAIRRSEIRCSRVVANDAVKCLASENAQLQQLLLRHFVDVAAAREHVEPTRQEVLKAIPRQLLDEQTLRELDRRWKKVALAVLAVRAGGDSNAIYKEQLEKNGIARAEFDTALAMYSSEDAQRVIDRDMVAETRKRVIADYTHREKMTRLRRTIEQTALDRKTSYETTAAGLWDEVLRATGVVIVDPQYSMPDLKGLP